MHGLPKGLKLDFLVEQEVSCLRLSNSFTEMDFDYPYYINFFSNFSINGKYYNPEPFTDETYRLYIFIGKKITSVKGIGKGDIKFKFNDDSELIIHEDNKPYESYTLNTPEGLVVV